MWCHISFVENRNFIVLRSYSYYCVYELHVGNHQTCYECCHALLVLAIVAIDDGSQYLHSCKCEIHVPGFCPH